MVKLTIIFKESTDVEKILQDIKNNSIGLGEIKKKDDSIYIEKLSMCDAKWARDRILERLQAHIKEINLD